MKVMVTGGTGFAGSHTVRALRAAGHELRLLVRNPKKLKAVFGADADGIGEVVVGDVTDEASVLRAMQGCDAVFHAAALVALEASRAREVLETNARAVSLVVEGAVRRQIERIVYVSSASALFAPGTPRITSEMPVAPARSAYARSKADAERTVRRLQAEGAPIRVSYPCGILGPDDPGLSEANHMLYSFYADTFVVTSAGYQVLDVRDLAEAHVKLLECPGGPCGYMLGGEQLTWREFGNRIDALTGAPMRRLTLPGPVLRAAGHVGDLIKRVYDFNFPLTIESMHYATHWPGVDARPAEQELGVRFRPADETLSDTLRWLVRAGHLPPSKIGRLMETEPGKSPS